MEIILVTPNPKYQSLISATKIIESSNVDIVSIIQTQVFLNHHYNISFYCIRNNFPYQFHCPLKISKLLLDRNQGAVELSISNGLNFKIQADTDTLEILLKIQNSLQGFESEQNVVFTLKYWQIHIRLVVLNQVYEQVKIKQLIEIIQQTKIQSQFALSQNIQSTTQYQIQQISKLIVFIDENNYEQFLGWSQSESIHFNYQNNEKLSNQYMSLKQEIDNEKNSFRNKIKMVEAILGENINIDKLLSQQKQQNQEYKRLRETFETIKNIDNVLIEQEKKLELKTLQLKQKRSQKHRVHYENAKKFAKTKYQISAILKEIQQLKYKCECVSANKTEYESRRNFEPNAKIKDMLVQQQKRCKKMIKNVSSFCGGPNKQESQIFNKKRTIQSLHKNEKKQQENYQNLLKDKVKKYRQQKENKNSLSLKDRLNEQTQKYEIILYLMAKYYEKNSYLLSQIKNKGQRYSTPNYSSLKDKEKAQTPKNISFIKKQRILNKDKCQKSINFNDSRAGKIQKSLVSPNIKWVQQFVVLRQLLENNPRSYNFDVKNNNNNGSVSVTNKIQSNLSIKYGHPDQYKQKDKEKEREKDKQKQKEKQQKNNKLQKSSIMTKNKQYKVKLKTKFDPEIKKKEKSQLDPQEQKSTITFK